MNATYQKKLIHPKWQQKRLEIINRDNCTCRFCSDKNTQLDVHHKYYKPGAEPWEYDSSALVSVCRPCHQCITYLVEKGHEPLLSVKLGDPNHPELVIILMVHKDFDGRCGVSMFVNSVSSNKMEYQNTLHETHIRKMNELLLMAENLR